MAQGRKVTIAKSDEIAEETNADEAYVISVEDTDQEGDSVEVLEEEPTSVEDLPDDERIWLDGPTAGQIKMWKQEHGDVYVTSISYDKHIAWRPLSRIEYKNLVRKMEQLVQSGQLTSAEANLWNEEAIAEICVLFPAYDKQSMVKEMAGLPSLIAQEVLEASGFVALEVRQL
jgi:hypothetical protein